MALPFIVGIALGAGVVVAYNKIEKLRDVLGYGVDKTKEIAACSFEKTKDVAADLKGTVGATMDCIKEKKETCVTSKAETVDEKIEIEKEEK